MALDGGGEEDWRGLLAPLADAQDALARLEAAVALASEAVRDGLVCRVAWIGHLDRKDIERIQKDRPGRVDKSSQLASETRLLR